MTEKHWWEELMDKFGWSEPTEDDDYRNELMSVSDDDLRQTQELNDQILNSDELKNTIFNVVSSKKVMMLTHSVDKDGKPIETKSEQEFVALNFNMDSKPLSQMSEDDRSQIGERMKANMHYEEGQIGQQLYETEMKNGKIHKKTVSHDVQHARYKFTKSHVIDEEKKESYFTFELNDETIFTLNLKEIQSESSQLLIGERGPETNPMVELCQILKDKTGLDIFPEDVPMYLEYGYLLGDKD